MTARAHPSVIVPVRAPRMPIAQLGPPELPDQPFTTKTYRRKKRA
jgi:hypothetical protein